MLEFGLVLPPQVLVGVLQCSENRMSAMKSTVSIYLCVHQEHMFMNAILVVDL